MCDCNKFSENFRNKVEITLISFVNKEDIREDGGYLGPTWWYAGNHRN